MKKGFFVFGLLAILLSGCSSNKLVGKWQGLPNTLLGPQQATVEFKSDGKYVMTMAPAEVQKPFTMVYDGSYTFKDDKLTVVITDISMKSDDPATQASLDGIMQRTKAQTIATLNATGPRAVTWNGDREMTTADASGPVTWKKL